LDANGNQVSHTIDPGNQLQTDGTWCARPNSSRKFGNQLDQLYTVHETKSVAPSFCKTFSNSAIIPSPPQNPYTLNLATTATRIRPESGSAHITTRSLPWKRSGGRVQQPRHWLVLKRNFLAGFEAQGDTLPYPAKMASS
jgi:hypothetical protein